jgi:hypothetical protein
MATQLFGMMNFVLKSDGTYAFIKDKAYIIIRDDSGKAIRMIGAQTDITVEQNLQEKLTKVKQNSKPPLNILRFA